MIKLVILVLNVCAALLTAFLLPPKSIYYVFQDTGYFFIFVSFFLWVTCLLKLYLTQIKSILRDHAGGLLLSTVLMVLIFCIAPPKFKILPDESNLIGVSMAMYQSKKAYLPTQGFNLDYKKPEYQITIDKRPLLYPLMVSLVHSLRGYSPYNGFVVNFILGIMVLFLLYLFINEHYPRIYSIFAVLISAGLPIFVMWVTSSGFETLNLFFIVLTIFLFKKVIATRSIQQAELLFLTLILVAQCRYESIVFTVAILFLLPILLRKRAISELSLITLITPFLFIPTIWLPRLYAQLPVINKIGSNVVQAANLYDAFSFSNLISNTSKNLVVFLGLDPNLGFSPVVAGLSLAGIYLMTKRLIVGYQSTSISFRTLWLFGIVTSGLLYFIQVSFYLGDMSLYSQNRFAMAYLPYLVLPAIYIIHSILNRAGHPQKILIGIFCVFHLLYFWPYGSQQLLVNTGSLPNEYNKTLRYIKDSFKNNSNILLISERPYLYVIHYAGAVDFAYANRNPEKILDQYGKEFDHILVLQRYLHNTPAPLHSSRLNPSYHLVHSGNLNLTRSEYLKVSEVTATN
jgi:hypothetical protein